MIVIASILPGIGTIELSRSPNKISPGPPSVMNQCRTACALVWGAAAIANFLGSSFIAVFLFSCHSQDLTLSAQFLRRFAKLAGSHSKPRGDPATVQPATKPLSASQHPLRASAAQNLSHCDSLLSGLCNKNSTEIRPGSAARHSVSAAP